MDILRIWGGYPEHWAGYRAEYMDILRVWASAPPG
jgi:hypothetical protein